MAKNKKLAAVYAMARLLQIHNMVSTQGVKNLATDAMWALRNSMLLDAAGRPTGDKSLEMHRLFARAADAGADVSLSAEVGDTRINVQFRDTMEQFYASSPEAAIGTLQQYVTAREKRKGEPRQPPKKSSKAHAATNLFTFWCESCGKQCTVKTPTKVGGKMTVHCTNPKCQSQRDKKPKISITARNRGYP